MQSTLWTTPDRQRFFIIADSDHLPEGDITLRTASGRQMQAAAEALSPYEVGVEEANKFAAGQMQALLLEVKRRLQKGSGDAPAPQPAAPKEAIFQAELMEGAAAVIDRLAEGLVTQMREQAETLREEAAQASRPVGPNQEMILAGLNKTAVDLMDCWNGYSLDGTGTAEDSVSG